MGTQSIQPVLEWDEQQDDINIEEGRPTKHRRLNKKEKRIKLRPPVLEVLYNEDYRFNGDQVKELAGLIIDEAGHHQQSNAAFCRFFGIHKNQDIQPKCIIDACKDIKTRAVGTIGVYFGIINRFNVYKTKIKQEENAIIDEESFLEFAEMVRRSPKLVNWLLEEAQDSDQIQNSDISRIIETYLVSDEKYCKIEEMAIEFQEIYEGFVLLDEVFNGNSCKHLMDALQYFAVKQNIILGQKEEDEFRVRNNRRIKRFEEECKINDLERKEQGDFDPTKSAPEYVNFTTKRHNGVSKQPSRNNNLLVYTHMEPKIDIYFDNNFLIPQWYRTKRKFSDVRYIMYHFFLSIPVIFKVFSDINIGIE